MQDNQISFTRVRVSSCGHPRYVCHFLNLNTQEELDNMGGQVSEKYNLALFRAKRIGGKKFHNKQYGGGIAFTSFNLDETLKKINSVTGRNFTGYTCK